MRTTRFLTAIATLLLSAGVAHAATPTLLTYSGFLVHPTTGNPLPGAHQFHFKFYTTSDVQIGTGSIDVTTTVGADGYFSVVINVATLANDPLFHGQMNMGVAVDSDFEMSPKVPVTSVPGALTVPYSGITGFTLVTPCAGGQFVTGYDVNGNFVCGTPTGGVTGVTAGAGLTGGGTGAVTLSANLTAAGGDNGTATTVARGDHAHDARYVQPATLSAAGTLNAGGNPVDWSKLKNVPAGIADGVDSDTTYTAGAGLTLSGGQFSVTTAGVTTAMLAAGAVGTSALADGSVTAAKLAAGAIGTAALADASVTFAKWASNSCATGNVPYFNGSAWACRAGGVTSVAVTAPLTLSGSGTVNPTLGITRASAVDPGYVTSLDYQKLAASLSFAATNATLTGDGTLGAPLGLASCAFGSGNMVMKWNGSTWGCDFDLDSGGTVRSVKETLNRGLVAAGTSVDPTLGIADNGVTTAMLQGTGVTAGTYRSVSVDTKGRISAGTNPTTIAGYGLTDAVQLSPASAQAGNVNVNGNGTFGGALSSVGPATLNTSGVGVSTVGNALTVNGNLTTGANLNVTGTITGNLAAGTVTPADLSGVAPTTGQVPSKAATDTFTWITPVTGVAATAGGGLAVTGSAPTPSVGMITSCAAGSVLMWNGSAWACKSMNYVTAGGSDVSGSLPSGSTGTTIWGATNVNIGTSRMCTVTISPLVNVGDLTSGMAYAQVVYRPTGGTEVEPFPSTLCFFQAPSPGNFYYACTTANHFLPTGSGTNTYDFGCKFTYPTAGLNFSGWCRAAVLCLP